MRKILTTTALIMFGVAPSIGVGCEYSDDSSASAAPPAQLASKEPVAASKVPTSTAARSLKPSATKAVAGKTQPAAAVQKVAASTAN
ncbi:MAG TPA: hypothetical protein VGK37_07780 [Casimicrobiaceae bacterium]|jgi:hypothetical protein